MFSTILKKLTALASAPMLGGMIVIGLCLSGVGSLCVHADPFDELAKLNPFRPRPQIIDQRPTDRGLWFHNQTNEPIWLAIDHHVSGANSVAVGEYNLPVVVPDGWMVVGWFEVPPNRTIQVLAGNLDNRYYGFYAHSVSKNWSGNIRVYVHPQHVFSYDSTDKQNTEHLANRGYVVRGFNQIDTGNATGFTVNLR